MTILDTIGPGAKWLKLMRCYTKLHSINCPKKCSYLQSSICKRTHKVQIYISIYPRKKTNLKVMPV